MANTSSVTVAIVACCVLVLSSLVEVDCTPPDSLRFVHALVQLHPGSSVQILYINFQLWRHGDRSPARTFPTDVDNPESSWPQGFGELSKRGMQQQYALGQWLRVRYDGFVSKRYSRDEIYVRSTDYNRTIMSALANLAGMFPPEGDQVWNASIPWQPIPVHSVPKEKDYVLWMEHPCPALANLKEEVRNWPEVKKIDDKHEAFYEFLTEKSGVEISWLDDMWHIWDPLRCEYLYRNDTENPHTPPSWANQTVYDKVKELYDWSYRYYYPNDEIQRIRGGPLLQEILGRMEERVYANTSEWKLKYYVYSAHDTVLTAILSVLGAFHYQPAPPYASLVLLELHERAGQWEIELYYRNDTTQKPYHLNITNCDHPCTLAQLRHRSEHLFVDDWFYNCGLTNWEVYYGRQIIAVLVIAYVVLLCLLCVFIYLLYRRMSSRKRDPLKDLRYHQVQTHDDEDSEQDIGDHRPEELS